MISFCVPAHDEEAVIEATLASIHASARAVGEAYEVVVADDASTDRTGEIAQACGARVISVQKRQIAGARNAAARAATGKVLMFVDADTLMNETALRAMLADVRSGAAGGGCLAEFDGKVPLWGTVLLVTLRGVFRVLRYVGGACLYCTRDAFEAAGGWNEEHYAGEEIYFADAIKKVGRFVVASPLVVTSGRKLRTFSGWEVLGEIGTMILRGPARATQSRDKLSLWYGARRADPLVMRGSEEKK